jgi:hypothetical protein
MGALRIASHCAPVTPLPELPRFCIATVHDERFGHFERQEMVFDTVMVHSEAIEVG